MEGFLRPLVVEQGADFASCSRAYSNANCSSTSGMSPVGAGAALAMPEKAKPTHANAPGQLDDSLGASGIHLVLLAVARPTMDRSTGKSSEHPSYDTFFAGDVENATTAPSQGCATN